VVTHEKIKKVEVAFPDAFGYPGAVVVETTNADVTCFAMLYVFALLHFALQTIPRYYQKHLFVCYSSSVVS